jgi:hypothetical protein
MGMLLLTGLFNLGFRLMLHPKLYGQKVGVQPGRTFDAAKARSRLLRQIEPHDFFSPASLFFARVRYTRRPTAHAISDSC